MTATPASRRLTLDTNTYITPLLSTYLNLPAVPPAHRPHPPRARIEQHLYSNSTRTHTRTPVAMCIWHALTGLVCVFHDFLPDGTPVPAPEAHFMNHVQWNLDTDGCAVRTTPNTLYLPYAIPLPTNICKPSKPRASNAIHLNPHTPS